MYSTLAVPLLMSLVLPARAGETFGSGAYYFGDLHAHTGYSGDAGAADLGNCTGTCGDVATVFDTARANGLDFLALTDHVNGGSSVSVGDYATLNAMVLAANDPAGGFVTLPGAEVWFVLGSSGDRLGHKTLLMFGTDRTLSALTLGDVRPGASSAINTCDDIWTWMDGLTATFGPAFVIPHHPAVLLPMPTDWSCHDDTYEPAVEIYSEHGNSLDGSDYDLPSQGLYAPGTAHAALDPDQYGLMFGFVSGTDSHDTSPGSVCAQDTEQPHHGYGGGLTVAVLGPTEAFDRTALYDAIAEHRTYTTTGPRLPVEIEWSAAGVYLGGLGEPLDAPISMDLDVVVRVPNDRAGYATAVQIVGPDDTWDLLADGAGNWTGTIPAGEAPVWAYAAVQIDGAAWYAPDGCADGGDDWEWLWTSPSPITLWEDDTDGDGVSVLNGDCDDGDPTVNPTATEVWYDGVDQDCDGADDYDQDLDADRASPWGTDCDDTDPARHSGAVETWYDGIDQDCDGADDYDQDGDGQSRADEGGLDCDDLDPLVGTGFSEIWYDGVDQDCSGGSDWDRDGDGVDTTEFGGLDCDDADPGSYPGAREVWYDGRDQGCDGGNDYDQDGDGHEAIGFGGADCDDTLASVHPGAAEIWYDGRDENCDGASDWDQDADGFDAISGGGEDCDDTSEDVSPVSVEQWYDGIDQDCDGASDWDQDGDGFDTAAWGGTDCDDGNAAIHPGAAEHWYDGIDQDCDPSTELDADGDGVPVPFDCHDDDPRVSTCKAVAADPAGCTTGPGAAAPGLAWLAALAALGARRRPALRGERHSPRTCGPRP